MRAKQSGKIKIELSRAKRAEIYFGKFCTISPIVGSYAQIIYSFCRRVHIILFILKLVYLVKRLILHISIFNGVVHATQCI